MALIRLPGLIDPHVHLREPGANHKEDWGTGTSAALAGGYTCVLAMPNTSPAITNSSTLDASLAAARKKAHCDYGVHLGASADNVATANCLASRVLGLKLYLNQTFGPLRLDGLQELQGHMAAWPRNRPLLCHAEGQSMAAALMVATLQDRPVHICHVSRGPQIALIRAARQRGLRVTCEVAPHHLFLTENDAASLGPGRSEVRPRLNTAADQVLLWRAITDGVIDCIASDHAPHTLDEKNSQDPPPGFPGLETTLALMLGAVREGRVTLDRLVAMMQTNPNRIFGIASQPETEVEVDPDASWEVSGRHLQSRCGWSPFEGWQLRGRVIRVTLRSNLAFEDGMVLAAPGSGKDVAQSLQ